MRTRSRGGLIPNTTTGTDYKWQQASTGISRSTAATGTFEAMNDVVTKSYQRSRAQGVIINNAANYSKQTASSSIEGHYIMENPANWNGLTAGTVYQQDRHGDWLSNSVNGMPFVGVATPGLEAEIRLSDYIASLSTATLSKVYSADAQVLTTLGELRETLSLIRHPLRSLGLVTRRYAGRRHFNVPGSQAWLGYRYGIRPLMADIENYINAANSHSRQFTARDGTSRNADDMVSTSFAQGTLTHSLVESYSVKYQIKTYALARVLATLSGSFGTTLRDIPIAAWELVPYSFVLDWFYNVGDYLNANLPRSDVNILASGFVVHYQKQGIRNVVSSTFPSGHSWIVNRPMTGQQVNKLEGWYRTPFLPTPTITNTNSKFENGLGLRWVDGFYLTAGFLSRALSKRRG